MSDDFDRYLKTMPVIPEVAVKVLSIAEDKLDISFKDLEEIIKVDPGLTAKILKIANSALYARQREIKSLQMAIALLGFKNIKSLVLLISASGTFSRHKSDAFFQYFWKHSILTAFLSKHLATRCNRKETAEDCFISGLLHDIGQVALYNADPDRYQPAINILVEGKKPVEEIEESIYGANHRDIGASLLAKWSFPDFYVDTAREHQSLNITSAHKSLIIIVSIADLLAEIIHIGPTSPDSQQLLQELCRRADLKDEDIQYYSATFMSDLQEDALFRECRSLFRIAE